MTPATAPTLISQPFDPRLAEGESPTTPPASSSLQTFEESGGLFFAPLSLNDAADFEEEIEEVLIEDVLIVEVDFDEEIEEEAIEETNFQEEIERTCPKPMPLNPITAMANCSLEAANPFCAPGLASVPNATAVPMDFDRNCRRCMCVIVTVSVSLEIFAL